MKITQLLPFALLACVLASCQKKASPSVATAAQSAAQSDGKAQLTRELPIHGKFSQVTVVSDMDVELRTGPCRVVVRGDSATIMQMRYDIDAGGLILSNPSEENSDINRYGNRNGLHVTVWSPAWRIVANCGNGRLYCRDALRTSFLHLGCIRDGKVELDSVVADTFRYDGSGRAQCRIGLLAGRTAELSVTSSAQVSACLDVDTFFCAADLKASATFTGRAGLSETIGNVTFERP